MTEKKRFAVKLTPLSMLFKDWQDKKKRSFTSALGSLETVSN